MNKHIDITPTGDLKFQKSNNICEYVGNIQLTFIENKNVRDYKEFEFITLDDMITFIRTGIIETMDTYDIREDITKIRVHEANIVADINPKENKEAKNKLKGKLPAYLFMAGDWNGFTREDEYVEHNKIQFIDIDDGITEERMVLVRELLGDSLIAEWKSSSGNGIGMAIYVKKMSKEEYTRSYTILSNYILAKTGLQIDKSCKNLSRLTFASWDTNIYYNPYNRVEFVHDESYANDIKIVCSNIDYKPNSRPLNKQILNEAYKFLYNLPEDERLIRHTEEDNSYDNKFSIISACTYAIFDKNKSDEDNALNTYNLFMSLFNRQERADLTHYAIKSSDEDEDTYTKILGLLKAKNGKKWKQNYDGGRRFLNIAIFKGFRGTPFEVSKPNVDILKTTYIDYISTPTVIDYVYDNCFKKGKKTYFIARTGTGKTKVIFENAIKRLKEGKTTIIVNPSVDCALQATKDLIKLTGFESAYALVGKENCTKEEDEGKTLVNRFKEHCKNKIIVTTQAAWECLYEIPAGYELILEYGKGEGAIIFDEAHTITSDREFRPKVCQTMKRIIDLYSALETPITFFSATPTIYDELVWKDFEYLDFRNITKLKNNLKVNIINSKNQPKRISNITKSVLLSIKNGKTVILRLNDVEKSTIYKDELIKSGEVDDTNIFVFNAKNRNEQENKVIVDSLHNNSLLPKECKILITTKIIDTSLNILNENIEYFFIDNTPETVQDITQAISRVRNAKEINIFSFNKEENIIDWKNKELNTNRDYFIYKDTAEKLISQGHSADFERNSYINSELDNLITFVGDEKKIDMLYVALKLNHKFTYQLSTLEKIQMIAERYCNNIIINNIEDYNIDSELTMEQGDLADTFYDKLKEQKVERKAILRQKIEDLLNVSKDYDNFLIQCYEEALISDEVAKELNINIAKHPKLKTNEGKNIDTEISRVKYYTKLCGFLDWKEAVKFCFDSSNDTFGKAKTKREHLWKLKGGKIHNPFKCKNTELAYKIEELVSRFNNFLCNENKVLTVTELRDTLIDFLKTEYEPFDITEFNQTVKKILELVLDTVVFENIRTKDEEGKTVRKKKFIRIKTEKDSETEWYEFFKSKGITKMQSLDYVLNPELYITDPNTINITNDTIHNFDCRWGDTSFDISFLEQA